MTATRGEARKRPRTLAATDIRLRKVRVSDLPAFFQDQLDPAANWMAAFTAPDPTDRKAFTAHWKAILRDPRIVSRTVLVHHRVRGHVDFFEMFGKPSIDYWYAREVWGQGVATLALQAFLREVRVRPVYARVANDNRGSIRVLEKCGFRRCGEDRGFAHARGAEIEEFIYRLDAG